MRTLKQSNRRCRGFSLVEVTIAMAIAAVAMVTLLGLIPQGMETMREAGDAAIEARIHQQILNEIQMADFESVDDFHKQLFFYDAQGEEIGSSMDVGSGSIENSFEHIFTARVFVPALINGEIPKSVGGASFGGYKLGERGPGSAPAENQFLRPVVIEIAPIGGRENFDWESADSFPLISTYQTKVVMMGRNLNSQTSP